MFEVASKYPVLWWQFRYDTLEFDIPYLHQRISTGPLVPHLLSWVTSLLFIFMVVVVFPRIKPSNPATVKAIAFWHYVGLFIFSTIACLSAGYVIVSRGELIDHGGFFCNQVPDWFRVLSILFMLSKYWEWLDTAIMIWNGKSLSDIGFLHLYHHATTVWVFTMIPSLPGSDKLGVCLNGFVHAMMYYHYAFRLPKFFRPIITTAQIIQLFVGIVSWGYNYEQCVEFQGYRENYPIAFYSLWAFVPIFFLFFLRFFVQTYIFGVEEEGVKPRTRLQPAADKVDKVVVVDDSKQKKD